MSVSDLPERNHICQAIPHRKHKTLENNIHALQLYKIQNPRQPPLPRWERRLPGVCSFSNKLLLLLIFHSALTAQAVLVYFEEWVVNEDTQDYQSKIEENVSEVHRG